MSENNIQIKDLSQQGIQQQECFASGLIIMSNQIYEENFLNNAKNDSILQIAITCGINAAKKTNEIFPMCHQGSITAINIDIQVLECAKIPKDITINQDITQIFRPKKFKLNDNVPQSNEKLSQKTTYRNQDKLRLALEKFRHQQDYELKELKRRSLSQAKKEYCGFRVLSHIKSQARFKPQMESMNALWATLLSLYDFVIDSGSVVISNVCLDSNR